MTLKPPDALDNEFESTSPIRSYFPVHLNDYLPVSFTSGVTDCTAAITAWGLAAQALGTSKGGVCMQAAPGTYNFTPTLMVEPVTPAAAIPMVHLHDLNGVTVDLSGATFADQRTYTLASTQMAELFRITNCQNVKWRGRVTSQANTTTDPVGLKAVVFHKSSRGMDVDLQMVGGRDGVAMQRLSTDAQSWRSGSGTVKVRTTNVFYPYSGQFSGDNMDVWITAEGPGRNFLVYDTWAVRARIRNKDQRLQSMVSTYSLEGCSDIEVWWSEDSATTVAGFTQLLLHYRGHSVPIAHRNIKVHFDIPQLPTDQCRGFVIYKTLDDQTTVDTTARGHTIDGLEISGYIRNDSATNFVLDHANFGELVVGDFMRNINLHDISVIGANACINFKGKALLDMMKVSRLTCTNETLFGNQANGRVVFEACQALRFSNDVLDIHHYIGSNVTGATQAVGDNKSFTASTGTNLAGLRVPRQTFASASSDTLVRDSGTDKWIYKDINSSPVYLIPNLQTISDADVTLAASTYTQETFYEAVITANRTVTLSTTNAIRGMKFRIVRAVSATGAFNLSIGTGPLKILAAGQWCEVVYNGAAWRLAAFGAL